MVEFAYDYERDVGVLDEKTLVSSDGSRSNVCASGSFSR